jgi:hypothetical protein
MTSRARPRPIAIACAALLGAPVAGAAVYTVIGSGPDAVTVIDPAAVERADADGAVRRAWSVSVKRSLVSDGPPQPGYVRMLNEYDCAAHRIRWRSFFVYSRFGAQVMHKDNDDASWKPAADSEADVGLRVACEGSAGRGAIAAKSVSQVVIGLMQAWDAAAPLPPLQAVDPPPRKKAAHRPSRRRTQP